MKYKQQHYIPASYLSAWVDQDTPDGYEPYVWVISRSSNKPFKRAPSNLFIQSDFYTMKDPDGERDVSVEKILSRVKGEFSRVKREKLEVRKPLDQFDKSILCSFAAAMHARTKAKAEHTSSQWKKALDMGKRMQEWSLTATEEQKRAMSAISEAGRSDDDYLTMEDVEEIVNNPIQAMMPQEIIVALDFLVATPMAVLTTSDNIGFITSDAPCVYFDPALMQKPPPFGAGGFISPSFEITLPLSPSTCIYFSSGFIGDRVYIDIDTNPMMLDQMNLRRKLFCKDSIIINQEVSDPTWFDVQQD